MDDPFSALSNAVESVFHLVKPRSNGKYIYSEIQGLKEALDNYRQHSEKTTFIGLVKALGAALYLFEKWRINFEPIKSSVDALASQHQMPAINWDKYLTHPKVSPRFQFGDQQGEEFISWLKSISKKAFMQQENGIIAMLIAYSEYDGFSDKLTTHLQNHPEFLLHLILESKENFIEISSSRLILHLTHKQIAQAIIHYLPELLQEHPDPFVQVEQLVARLNVILTHGCGISTLLRNSEAKAILDSSEFFQIYQSEQYKNRQAYPLFVEDEYSKPQI
ncbi:hypothetical protein [Legionella tucsonensis]|uniref:Uncharacterized protein n=1 Tax=Legionella tucsonensis TaxID=40335 RepID=A0A0W0ZXZ4_9GAMM|nr:hypothetical protein [Legionella tucsonensis]KTD73967.1 hypothetical protein Ltuc_1814 [Legionella tucsonensis]